MSTLFIGEQVFNFNSAFTVRVIEEVLLYVLEQRRALILSMPSSSDVDRVDILVTAGTPVRFRYPDDEWPVEGIDEGVFNEAVEALVDAVMDSGFFPVSALLGEFTVTAS